jgi:succinyl-CoA synthetase alpha subunit
MGHAGAIIEGNTGSAESKITAFKQAGVKVVSFPEEIATLIAAVLKQKGA